MRVELPCPVCGFAAVEMEIPDKALNDPAACIADYFQQDDVKQEMGSVVNLVLSRVIPRLAAMFAKWKGLGGGNVSDMLPTLSKLAKLRCLNCVADGAEVV